MQSRVYFCSQPIAIYSCCEIILLTAAVHKTAALTYHVCLANEWVSKLASSTNETSNSLKYNQAIYKIYKNCELMVKIPYSFGSIK